MSDLRFSNMYGCGVGSYDAALSAARRLAKKRGACMVVYTPLPMVSGVGIDRGVCAVTSYDAYIEDGGRGRFIREGLVWAFVDYEPAGGGLPGHWIVENEHGESVPVDVNGRALRFDAAVAAGSEAGGGASD